MPIDAKIAELKVRRRKYFAMAQAFVENQDSHGIMDAGAELQALERAIKEL